MSDCDYYRELCSALLDGELDAGHEEDAGIHLASCPTCQQAYGEMRAFSGLIRNALASVYAPAALRRSVRSMIDANPVRVDRPAARARVSWKLMWAPAAAVAATLLLVLNQSVELPLATLESRALATSSARVFTDPEAAARHVGSEIRSPVQAVSMQQMGLKFSGAGKVFCGGCPGVFMSFSDNAGHQVTVFELCARNRRLPAGDTVAGAGLTARRLKGQDGCELVFWPQNGLLIVVCTDLGPAQAARASRIVSAQIQTD